MEQSLLQVGAVYVEPHDPDRPRRVLAFDADVVMYDAWWSDIDGWGMADLDLVRSKRFTYYVTPTAPMLDRARYLRAEPLTEEETAVHRPDLPLSVGRWAEVDWADVDRDGAQSWSGEGAVTAVDAPELYLYPFGANGREKRGVLVKAGPEGRFAVADLLRTAAGLQVAHPDTATVTSGVGLYRCGLNRARPAYYLWGHRSRLEG